MVFKACKFETERLLVNEWHSTNSSDWRHRELGGLVAAMLTEPVTRTLPDSWQGPYSLERAREWVNDRDEEGTTLLVIDKSTRHCVGLMILIAALDQDSDGGMELRLGYLLSESAWGKGIASELVEGFVGWCRGQAQISSIAGGVGLDNPASGRVLEKSGFNVPIRDWLMDVTDMPEHKRGLRSWAEFLAKSFRFDGLKM